METLLENIVILLFYFPYICITSSVSTELPLWSWECLDDQCIPSKVNQNIKPQSLDTCNMLCSSIKLWPQPTGQVSLAIVAVPVRADMFQLESVFAPTKTVRKHLTDVFEIFQQDLQYMEKNLRGFEEWRAVLVNIYVNDSGDPRMRLDTDESYELILNPSEKTAFTLIANITARSFCGARHALETLTQLIWLDHYSHSLMILQAATIKDAPKFRYRGLLIDTARSYFPVSALLRTIDAMASSKLNTLHWHVSDSQAFSLQLNSVPQLSQYGAYSSRDVYSSDQVRIIARRARLRGIRVMIEIDIPAHVGRAWNWGPDVEIGDLVHCIDPEQWHEYCSMPPCGQLNPTNPHVFEILQRVYAEIVQLTGVDDLFHLGGSDISKKCWAQYFSSDPTDLWIDFTKSALLSLQSLEGNMPNLTLFWASSLSKRLKLDFNDFVHGIGLQTRNIALVKNAIGIRTVLSHEDSWDLNSGYGEWYEESGGSPYNSWQRVYEHRPWVQNRIVVEGGEATVWSWNLSVGELDSRIWPRAAALAERLWTDRPEGATRMVHARLDVHRTRMISRGMQAAPIWSNWCTQNTHTCN